MTEDRTTVTFDRREVVARLLRDRRDLVAVSSLGSATYDVAAAGDHDRNFYLWGAMGGAIPLALGLALAQPEIPVAALVGDGEALMAMGSFATVALQHPANLSIVILDNERYGETGGQLSHTASGVDLAGIARACGISNSLVVANDGDVEGSSLTATLVIGPAHAFAFSLNPDGSYTYTPQASFTGTDTFTYRACEVVGTGTPPATAPVLCSNIATVRITVTPGPTGPGATGGLTTYTQGGWGAKPSGNNPGALLAARFTGVYGATGVKIGNQGSPYSLTFTAAANVEDFLPGGGTASKLTASAINPFNSSAGVFAGQVLALQISYDFSNAGVTTFGLATKCVTSGPLAGKTVQYVLDLANKVIGGNTALLAANGLSSISVLNDIITRINENYDGGKINKGYLGACQ